ncbi:hypothetical protein [Stetteria hydrogenophila]
MVLDVFKRVLGRGRPGVEDYAAQWGVNDYLGGVPGAEGGAEEGFDYDSVVARLEYRRREIESMRDMIVREIDEDYKRMVEAAKQGDRETLELIAADAALKERLAKALTVLVRMIHLAIGRVRAAKSAEEILKAIQPVVMMVRSVNESIAATAPELAVQLEELREEVEKLYNFQGVPTPVPVRSIAETSPEARELIRKALAEASRDAEKILPKPPAVLAPAGSSVNVNVDIEEVASKLLEYIKSTGGRVKVSQAAKALGVAPEVIKRALLYLEEKGVIKIQRKQPLNA